MCRICFVTTPQVMHARSTESEAVSDAMEMAVLSSVVHPNIVQVFSCLTDMVELPRGELVPRVEWDFWGVTGLG